MKRIIYLLLIALLCTALLSACGDNSPARDGEKSLPFLSDKAEKTAAPTGAPDSESVSAPAQTPPKKEQTVGSAAPSVLLREGELFSVEIADGAARLVSERWDAIYDGAVSKTGAYPILTVGDRVADACIGSVDGRPAVLLLMADKTVEYLPLGAPEGGVYLTGGTVPWLENIAALSLEETGEGVGETTIYATDESGVRYDALLAARYCSIFSGEWLAELDPEVTLWSGYFGKLIFVDETQLQFLMTLTHDVAEVYIGTYRLVLTEDDEYSKGSLILDLSLDWTLAEGVEGGYFPRREIKGAYFVSPESGLSLWLADGDCLYDNQFNQLGEKGEPKTEYFFTFAPYLGRDHVAAGYSELEIRARNTICTHSKVAEYLALGMKAVCTGETPFIDGSYCYETALGTEQDGHFVREQFYAIDSFTGQIYEFDPALNDWYALEYY